MKTQFVVITQQVEGDPESGYATYCYSDLKLFDDRKRAIRHGFRVRESDDFNLGTVKDGRLRPGRDRGADLSSSGGGRD